MKCSITIYPYCLENYLYYLEYYLEKYDENEKNDFHENISSVQLIRNRENEVNKPSFVDFIGPPYFSSSNLRKCVKYTNRTPAFIRANLTRKKGCLPH